MAFHEVRFPEDISAEAVSVVSFSTKVITASSGFEQRVGMWQNSRNRWDISYKERTSDSVKVIAAFFRARKGRLHGFRFKDWSDYKAVNQPLANPQPAVVSQLSVLYSDLSGQELKAVRKPVAGTVTIKKNGVNFASAGNWTLDTTTGLVTFNVAPAPGDVFTWSGEYDQAVRFEADELRYTQHAPTMYSVENLTLVEVRV